MGPPCLHNPGMHRPSVSRPLSPSFHQATKAIAVAAQLLRGLLYFYMYFAARELSIQACVKIVPDCALAECSNLTIGQIHHLKQASWHSCWALCLSDAIRWSFDQTTLTAIFPWVNAQLLHTAQFIQLHMN
eukprot:scaffold165241_cov43-Prasinocladus_malaysianus.AAC.1